MTQNVSAPLRSWPAALFASVTRLFARLGVGVLLILLAGIVASVTAIAGVILAMAALVLRFGARRRAPVTIVTNDEGGAVTLEARHTPRGWTVE